MLTSLLMTFLGYSLLGRLKEENLLMKIALGFLVGYGITTIPLFLLTYFHIRLNPVIIIGELFVVALLGLFLSMKEGPTKITLKKMSRTNGFNSFIFFILALTVFISFVINWYWPVNAWDSMTLYDFRARLYASGGLLTDLWNNVERSTEALSYYYSYPPLTSLAHTISYTINDNHSGVIYSFFYLSLLLIFFSSVSKLVSRATALIFTFLLAANFTIFSHTLLAYTNIPYTTFIVSSFLVLSRFIQTKNNKYFWLSTFLTSTTILIRSTDPFPFVLLILFILPAFKERQYLKYGLILFVMIWLIRLFAYSHFKNDLIFLHATQNNHNNLISKNALQSLFDIHKYQEVLAYIYLALKKYYAHLIIFALSFFLFSKKTLVKNLPTILFILFSILILIPGTLILSTTYEGWNRVPDSLHRLVFFLYPLILFYLCSIPEVDMVFSKFSKRK